MRVDADVQTMIAELFNRLTQGVYVVGVGVGTKSHAFTAAWVMQVSFDPLLLVLSINPQHRSYVLLQECAAFSVNALSTEQLPLAVHFGQPGIADKLAKFGWRAHATGVPVLDDVPAWFECRVLSEHAAGDHRLVVGRVVGGELRVPAARMLRYADTGGVDQSVSLFPKRF